jgi:uroporphyrin-III C-methyltransferase
MNGLWKQARVVLVGAGPGDPELLTLKAARLLGQADVVLYDYLSGDQVLSLCRPDARLVCVGKRPDGDMTQARIHELLLDAVAGGGLVVRLKGGDPFVFGRGGEEVEFLRGHGVEVEVVPGVSSAIAGPALAGIPVTHRGVSQAVSIVTGHAAAGNDEVDQTLVHLARAGGTIVVLMGMRRIGRIAEQLMAGGLSARTPLALVHAASTPMQQVVVGELGGAAQLVAASGFNNHTLIVVGPVVDVLRSTGGADMVDEWMKMSATL